ncbi:YeeE/YedE thiosulfate transporter family protein [Gaetbulibacter aquiaggeris]|uniref:YeeE/YedE thiosulfate transporter family protein n=1 Tax=Gaetbulibacter aquiaggeris TaxID=1735373 RepID=A0ABW7MSE4_9FLAO
MEYILNPWPWYISGPLIALVMAMLLYFGKTFAMSSNLATMCSMAGAGKFIDFFRSDWKEKKWNLIVILGALIGGFISKNYLSVETNTNLNLKTINELNNLGFNNSGKSIVPDELFGFEAITSAHGLLILIIGGILIGFGTRYAGGCTSGHAITGLSSLQKPSLIAVVGFFIGGLIMTNFILPYIL